MPLFPPDVQELLQNIMGPIGAVLACAMFSSAFPVLRDIQMRKDVGEYSYFPYLVQLCNTSLWSAYSISDYQDGKMFWPLFCNVVGFVIVSGAFTIYFRYCKRDDKVMMIMHTSVPLIIVFTFCGYCVFVRTRSITSLAGTLCLIINMIMYAGPLAGIHTALATMSVEFLPLSLGVSTVTCSLPWFFYGVAIENMNIWLPNSCGIVFGAVQVSVYMYLTRFSDAVPAWHTDSIRPEFQRTASVGNIFFMLPQGGRMGRSATWDVPLAGDKDVEAQPAGLRPVSTAPGELRSLGGVLPPSVASTGPLTASILNNVDGRLRSGSSLRAAVPTVPETASLARTDRQ
jgi:solute carrier family 50 protein (sugar transporter)